MKTLSMISATVVLASLFTSLPAAAGQWFSCQPTEVIEMSNRIHVRCSNTITLNGDTVRFIAIDKSDVAKAARFISLGTAALLSGKYFRAGLPDSGSGNVPGCSASDCRTPINFGVMD